MEKIKYLTNKLSIIGSFIKDGLYSSLNLIFYISLYYSQTDECYDLLENTDSSCLYVIPEEIKNVTLIRKRIKR